MFDSEMQEDLQDINSQINFILSSTRNVLDCTEEMDGNTSDQFEEDIFESISNETVGIEQRIKDNKKVVSDIEEKLAYMK